ncbi:PREDICTED: insulin-like peptide receptor [Rhagoletis zephyria]|uniref:insulin-like peptide receptor n=1 Tax=Rhagoletis zephyria TaxID=28612 RepID=UPI00081199AA|nr:PREDICTED: insulin-like peptide receptor [Rhagoletis zephyria]
MPSKPSPSPRSTASRRQQLLIRSTVHYNLRSFNYVADEPQRIYQLWRITDTVLQSQQEQHQMQHRRQQLPCKHYQQNVCNIALFMGITAPHLKFCNNNKFLLILFLCVSLLLLAGNCLPTVMAATNPRIPYRPPKAEPGECRSIDVRNECASLNQLHNCTVIRGFLLIVLLPSLRRGPQEVCDYGKYSFPLLREITDFLIFHDVKGLRSIRDLFPNLAVIRGRRLFLNYALGITNMPDLEALEFKSLIAIQRGHVYINNCPKLCNLDKINWDRLTLSVGENQVFPIAPESCPTKTVCQRCATEYCWSNDVCQRFENDNLIDTKQGIQHCHSECLGGCSNSSSVGCLTCKNLMDHGSCVKECPPDKYLFGIFQNCYTESECKQNLNMTIENDQCLLHCPQGSIFDVSISCFNHQGNSG